MVIFQWEMMRQHHPNSPRIFLCYLQGLLIIVLASTLFRMASQAIPRYSRANNGCNGAFLLQLQDEEVYSLEGHKVIVGKGSLLIIPFLKALQYHKEPDFFVACK